LTVTAAYSSAQLKHLFKTGTAIGDRKLGMMAQVCNSRFSHFTDEEIEAIHAFLTAFSNSE
jgi:hypothetical protein